MIFEASASELSSLQAMLVGDCRDCDPLVADGVFVPTRFVHLMWIAAAFALTILGLRSSKAWKFAQDYEYRAREGCIFE